MIGAPPQYYKDRDVAYDIDSPIFNAPLPVSYDDTNKASRRKIDIAESEPVQLSRQYNEEGIVSVPMRRLVGNVDSSDIPIIYRPRFNSNQNYRNKNWYQEDYTSVESLSNTRPVSQNKAIETAQISQHGTGRIVSEKSPIGYTFEDSVVQEFQHPNHRYREDFVDSRPKVTDRNHKQRQTPYKMRTEISEPEIHEFQKKQKLDLLHYRIKQQRAREVEEKRRLQEKLVPERSEELKPKYTQAKHTQFEVDQHQHYRSEEVKPKHDQAKHPQFQEGDKQHYRSHFKSEELQPKLTHENNTQFQEDQKQYFQSEELNPTLTQAKNPQFERVQTKQFQITKTKSPTNKRSPTKHITPIPLAPVYSQEQLLANEENLSVDNQSRTTAEIESMDHIPEFRETIPKDKRQTHEVHGSYADHNGAKVRSSHSGF